MPRSVRLGQRREDGHADAIVGDLNGYVARRCASTRIVAGASFGVAMHVGEGLLDDAEHREFDFLGEAYREFRGMDESTARPLRSANSLAYARKPAAKTDFVHERRVKDRGDGANFADGVGGENAGGAQQILAAAFRLRAGDR